MRGLLLIMMGLAAGLSGGCATSGAVPRPFPNPDWEEPVAANAPDEVPGAPPALGAPRAPSAPISGLTGHRYDGRAVAEFALGFRGVPYRLGGADPAGFDCSGLVQYVFAQYGIDVPRVVEQQYGVGDKIKANRIKPGDLLFFNTNGPGASHVGIAIDEERFVHAPNSTGVVRVETLGSGYWGPRYIGARRVTASQTTSD